jgi:hypothetical protein
MWRCPLHGHADPELKFDRNRIYLRCPDCDRESPGWTIEKPSQTRKPVGAEGTSASISSRLLASLGCVGGKI